MRCDSCGAEMEERGGALTCVRCDRVGPRPAAARAAKVKMKPKPRGRRAEAPGFEAPDGEFLEGLRNRLVREYGDVWFEPRGEELREELRREAQGSLYFLCKFVLGMTDLTRHLHAGVCEWLQDMGSGRRKLLMLPVNHLKTSMGSHGLPIHMLVQDAKTNCYFPGRRGRDMRLLLAGETEPKAKENLDFIKRHMTTNPMLYWLWPDVFWENPKREAPRWTDLMIEVKREKISAEPSITVVGTETGLMQRHYDFIGMDDIATKKAWESVLVMQGANSWRKSARSRLHDPNESVEIGIGTYWGSMYDDWQKESNVDAMVRSAIEDERPIWPERFTMETLDRIRREEVGDLLFSMCYMNRAAPEGYSALDWEALRQFRFVVGKNGEEYVEIEEGTADEEQRQRVARVGTLGIRALQRGDPLTLAYPSRARDERGRRKKFSHYEPEFKEFMEKKYPERTHSLRR